MSADEDTELRDLIVQSLETNGVLDKIKAQLRAAIFVALEEEGNVSDKVPLINKKLRDFIITTEGKKIISLVREFLNFFNMESTLSVFEPEALNSTFLYREELCKEYNISTNSNLPVIAELLKVNPSIKDEHYLTDTISQSKENEINSLSHNISSKIDNLIGSSSNIVAHAFTAPLGDISKGNSKNILFDSNSFGMRDHSSDSAKCSEERMKSFHDPFYDGLDSQSTISHDSENILLSSDNAGNIDLDILSKENTDLRTYKKTNESREITSLLSQLCSKSEDANFITGTKHKDNKSPISFKPDISERSMSSLRDLPALNVNPKNLYDSERDKTSAVQLYSCTSKFIQGRCSDDGEGSQKSELQESSTNINRYDPESHENSEQSIEEEIDDEVSAGLDDLLSSISVGDETTNDATVSQISNIGGIDHIENSHNV